MNADRTRQVNFRLPALLIASLRLAAAANHRSLTSEISFRLQQSLLAAKESA